MSKKTVYEQTKMDYETGEIKEKLWIRQEGLTLEMFVRTYVQDIGLLTKCSGAMVKVVLCSLKYLNYDTNEIVFNAARRKEIALCAGISLNTVNTSISRLYKKDILVKDKMGRIFLNPKLFFFGTDIARANTLRLVLSYKLAPGNNVVEEPIQFYGLKKVE